MHFLGLAFAVLRIFFTALAVNFVAFAFDLAVDEGIRLWTVPPSPFCVRCGIPISTAEQSIGQRVNRITGLDHVLQQPRADRDGHANAEGHYGLQHWCPTWF